MPDSASLALHTAAITDIGRVRRQNEDRFLRADATAFYAVADGIGGLPGGAAAAQACIDALSESMEQPDKVNYAADLVPILHDANERVLNLGRRISPQIGIGSTLLCGAIRDDRLLIAHVGDSRAYLIREGKIAALTEDHSVENDLKRTGSDPSIPLEDHQLAALTRCIGQPDAPQVDVAEETLRHGDMILLATDGVYRVIDQDELPGLLTATGSLSECLARLIALVNERGAPDNATAVLIVVE